MTKWSLSLTATILLAFVVANAQPPQVRLQPERPLTHEWLFDVRIDLEPPLDIGPTGAGRREIIYIRRGTIEGPHLQAEVLPGGGDWLLRREDGSLLLDIRAVARTGDGHLIYIAARGLYSLTPEGMQHAQEGKPVPAKEQYFREALMFETSAEPYAWLNRTLAVGVGEFSPGSVKVSVYAIR